MNISINGSLIENIELVIFDKDGTLIDLYAYWSWIAKERAWLISERLSIGAEGYAAVIDAMGLDTHNECFKPEGPIGVKKRTEVAEAVVAYLMAHGIGKYEADNAVTMAFAKADENVKSHLYHITRPLSGAASLIKSMKSKCKVAVATADLTERAENSLAIVGISHLDCVVGGDKTKKGKPDPEIIKTILSTLSVKKENTIVIGDSKFDMMCGKNANVKAVIGVCTGLTNKKELMLQTDYVIDTLNEIVVVQ